MSDIKHILIVEDESILALSTSRIIKKNGFEAKIVHSGEKAVAAVSENLNIDLVLMDIDLGRGIDGTEAARQILMIRELPIIFLTSHSEKEYVDKVKSITRYGFVVKDSGEFVLMESINMAFELFEVNRKLKEDISKRIGTEKELKKSESRLSTIFHSSPAGICINTADKGIFLDVNEAFTKITGYKLEEILGKTPEDLGLWVSEGEAELAETQMGNSGKITNAEMPFVKSSGDIGYAMISSEYIDYNGLGCVLTLINDITESKKTLSDLSESRKMLDNTQKAARLDTWTVEINTDNHNTTTKGDIIWFDTKNGFNIQDVLNAAHPDDRELVKCAWNGVLEGRPFEIEHRAIINGQNLWFYVKAEVELDKNNRPGKVIGVTLDITERKKAEEEILYSISLLKASLESTADGILVVDNDGKIKIFNQRFADMWKVSYDSLENKTGSFALKLVIEQIEDPGKFLERIDHLNSNLTEESFDEIHFKDGRVFERYSMPQRINENVVGRVWSFRDVSEKFLYEEALSKSEQKLRAIINSVPDIMFTIDKTGVILEHHTRDPKDLYVQPEEFLGRNLREILPAEVAEPALGKIKDALLLNVEQRIEYKLNMKGDERYYEDRIIKSSENEVLSIIRDITESRNNRQDLIKREKIFSIISQFAEKIFKDGINSGSIGFVLSGLGKAFDLSRSYIFRKYKEDENEIMVEQVHEWCADGVFSAADVLDLKSFAIPKNTKYSEKIAKMLTDGYMKIKVSDTVDDEYESKIMEVQELKSFLFIPIFVNEQWWGLIGFDECKFEREWSEHEIEALKTAANILGGSLEKDIAVRELADSRELYYTLIDASPDSYSVTDIYGNQIFASSKALELFGHAALEEVTGKNVFGWVTDDYLDIAKEKFSNMLKSGITETATFKLKKKDGTEFMAELTASRYSDAEGNPKGLIIITRDITQKLLAEKTTAEEAVRRKILIDGSSDGIVILDSNGKLIEANKMFIDMLGYNETEAMNLFVWDWDKSLNKSAIEFMISSLDQSGDHFETRHRRKDGSEYDVEISSNGTLVNGNKMIFCVCRDITTRKAAEKKIRESEERFSRIFHSNPVGIAITKVETGEYVDVNDSLIKMLGYSREELIGKNSVEIGVFDRETREKLIEVMKETGKVNNAEINYQRRDGTMVNLIYSLEPIELNSSEYLLSIVLDISEKKKSELQLMKSLDEKNVLLKELQHRVKNNLSVISSLLHLELENLKEEQSRNIFQNSISRINSLAAIYEQLYSSESLTEVNLSSYLSSLIVSLSKTYNLNEKITIKSEIKKDAKIDLKRSVTIGLIYNELISNSLKYSYPEGNGTIYAGFEFENGIAKLFVKDHGLGLPPDFDVKNSKSLGLRLVQMLTEQLEGELKINSDEGTSVEISFKL